VLCNRVRTMQSEQVTLFGDSIDTELYIKTDGRVIRPWKRMLSEVAAEFRLQANDDGLYVTLVDSANVMMAESTLFAEVFEAYEPASDELGLDTKALGSVLRHARYGKGQSDMIELAASASERTLTSDVRKTVGDTQVTVSEQTDTIDPVFVKEPPEMPDIETGAEVDLQAETLIKAIGMMDNDSDIIALESTGDTVRFGQESDTSERQVSLDVATKPVGRTLYSRSYVENMATMLRNGYVDTVTLQWAEEFPMFVDFEREGVYGGTVCVAPRIQSE